MTLTFKYCIQMNKYWYRLASFLLIVVFGGITACEDPRQTATNASKTYFDLRGFMQEQIAALNKLQPKVKKEILNAGKSSNKVVQVKNWERELRMFVNADINKAALIGTYQVKDSSSAGKQYVKYISKESKNVVKQMLVELDATKKQAKSIKIEIGSDNLLFASGTQLSFVCKQNPKDKQYRITHYQIDGFQKIIMRDKRPYFIKATIL